MGMAASQARFLALTARKSNTEYEGQQVNQQRTALSNQSAGLYNQMMALKVPTPPSASDYYTMRYTYNANGQNYEIVSYTSSKTVAGAYDVTVRTSFDEVSYNETKFNKDPQTEVQKILSYDSVNNQYYMTYGTSSTQYVMAGPAVNSGIDPLNPNTKYYSFNRDGTTYYMTQDKVENQYEPKPWGTLMDAYQQNVTNKTKDTTYNGVTLVKDSSGQFSYITLPDGSQYALSVTQVNDQKGYEEAMNKYNYQKMIYEKTISDINAKTETIQAEDRTLELRLKQLDTEQNALQTEMDAVQKVIEKNVETTFKTFA